VVTLVQLTGDAKPAAALACVCRLHVVAVRLAARVSDEKRITGVVREMRYTNWHFYLLPLTEVIEYLNHLLRIVPHHLANTTDLIHL